MGTPAAETREPGSPGSQNAWSLVDFQSVEADLAQKADIIINHFRAHVAGQVGGKAKAMVVTASRLHALRYGDALKKHSNEHGIGDVGILVAFSSSLRDGDVEWTETKVNGFPESQVPQRFDTDEFQILVVAEKYQTGFDQPKLHRSPGSAT